MDRWLINGEPGDRLAVTDRGFHYGDGLFETMAIRHGAPRFLQRHLKRLNEGCRRLFLPIPDENQVLTEIVAILGGARSGTVKLIITRGSGPRGYRLPKDTTISRILGFSAQEPDSRSHDTCGMKVMMCRTPAGINPLLAGLKTLNRLENVLACAEWQKEAVNEGLMFDPDHHLVGGTMSNVFMVRQGSLHTPALRRNGVHGVMRAVIIDLALDLGVPVIERDISRSEVCQADELFLTNALIGLRPVTVLDGHHYQHCVLTRDLAAALREQGGD